MTTAAEQARLDAIHAMPCIACEIDEQLQPNRTEAHHLVDKGTRKHSGGHMATIPLCQYHHRGTPYVSPLTGAFKEHAMLRLWGPSLALHKRRFLNRYGTERELLARVDEKLRRVA